MQHESVHDALVVGRQYLFRQYPTVFVICDWVRGNQVGLSVYRNNAGIRARNWEFPSIQELGDDCLGDLIGEMALEPAKLYAAIQVAAVMHSKLANNN